MIFSTNFLSRDRKLDEKYVLESLNNNDGKSIMMTLDAASVKVLPELC